MNDARQIDGQNLEQFRSYLYLLARANLNPKLQQKIDASDLVQQTMLDAHAQRNQFRGNDDAQLAGWLKQILAHNLADALRHHGRAKRDVARQRSLEATIDDSFCRAEDWLIASVSSPSHHVSKKEELIRLADALGRLPEAQQNAIVLHHLQGLTLAQTAEQLQRTEAAVAGLLYRGLKRLHELLGE